MSWLKSTGRTLAEITDSVYFINCNHNWDIIPILSQHGYGHFSPSGYGNSCHNIPDLLCLSESRETLSELYVLQESPLWELSDIGPAIYHHRSWVSCQKEKGFWQVWRYSIHCQNNTKSVRGKVDESWHWSPHRSYRSWSDQRIFLKDQRKMLWEKPRISYPSFSQRCSRSWIISQLRRWLEKEEEDFEPCLQLWFHSFENSFDSKGVSGTYSIVVER